MLEALETRFIDNAQELCSNAALTQVHFFLRLSPRPPSPARPLSSFERARCHSDTHPAPLSQAVRAVAAPPRSRKVARAWAHPGTDVGGVVGGSAVDDEADDSLKVCCVMRRERCC